MTTLTVIDVKSAKLRNNIKKLQGKMLIHTQMRHIRITSDFMLATLKAKKAWNDVLQALIIKNSQARTRCPTSYFLTFPDNYRLRQSTTIKPALQKHLKEYCALRKKKESYP